MIDLKEYFNKRNFRFKFKYFILPEFILSLTVAVAYPFVAVYMLYPLYQWIYKETHWSLFGGKISILYNILLIPIISLVIYYFFYGKKRVKIFSKSGRKSTLRIVPLMTGFLSAGFFYIDTKEMTGRMYQVPNTSYVINHPDSIDIYKIKNHYIDYEFYNYGYDFNSVKKGTKYNRYYVTEVKTYVVTPLLRDSNFTYESKSHRIWVAFEFSEEMDKEYDLYSPEVLALQQTQMDLFKQQTQIEFFRETWQGDYKNLIKEMLGNDSIRVKDAIILKAHFEPYKVYDRLWFRVGTGIFLVLHSFVFLVVFFTGMNEEEVERLETAEK